ncbi:MAG: STAS domain-containing protein [Chloroflexota bacterium]
MEILVSQEQGRVPVTVFKVKGNIDSATYQQLAAQARQAFEGGMKNLLLDLSEAPYVSSAGIRALNDMILMLKTSAESDEAMNKGIADGSFKSPHVKLLNPNRNVAEVLRLAGMDMLLEVHQDYRHAIASF